MKFFEKTITRDSELICRRFDKSLPLPQRAHRKDAGLDLYCSIDVTLQPGERALTPTGIAIVLPTGTVGFIHPRSGLAVKHGLGIVNSPGVIDEGYTGEVHVCLINFDQRTPIKLHRGDRIAQLIVQKIETPRILEVEYFLIASDRGDAGFGSTGH